MLILGGVLGLLTAWMLHLLFGQLRRRWPTPISALGWIVTVVSVVFEVGLTDAYWVMRNDLMAPMGPFYGFLAVMVGLLWLFCAGLGRIYRRRFGITWAQVFGVLMAEAGAAYGIVSLLNAYQYSLADFLIAPRAGTGQILATLEQVGYSVNCFNLSLLVSLLLLSAFAGKQTKAIPRPDEPPA